MKRGQSGELRLSISYANLALSFSSSDTGDGWSICQRKRSASLPVRTGVSLIGLAIITAFFCYHVAKVNKIFEMCTNTATKKWKQSIFGPIYNQTVVPTRGTLKGSKNQRISLTLPPEIKAGQPNPTNIINFKNYTFMAKKNVWKSFFDAPLSWIYVLFLSLVKKSSTCPHGSGGEALLLRLLSIE